ncbi:MAG: hypothetical protein MZW92_56840 [Comamonadaceae bacterium]|nr:hypothetical protein [Comamonadaceae bacterium]
MNQPTAGPIDTARRLRRRPLRWALRDRGRSAAPGASSACDAGLRRPGRSTTRRCSHGLTAWLRLPQRRLVLLAPALRRRAAPPSALHRLAARLWPHAVEAWQAGRANWRPTCRALLLDDGRAQRAAASTTSHWRGRAGRRRRGRHALCATSALMRILQRSTPAFAVDTLGL